MLQFGRHRTSQQDLEATAEEERLRVSVWRNFDLGAPRLKRGQPELHQLCFSVMAQGQTPIERCWSCRTSEAGDLPFSHTKAFVW